MVVGSRTSLCLVRGRLELRTETEVGVVEYVVQKWWTVMLTLIMCEVTGISMWLIDTLDVLSMISSNVIDVFRGHKTITLSDNKSM